MVDGGHDAPVVHGEDDGHQIDTVIGGDRGQAGHTGGFDQFHGTLAVHPREATGAP